VLCRTPNNDIYGSGNHDLLNELGCTEKHFVLMGDFNYRTSQWPPVYSSNFSADTRDFYNCLEDNFFTQHVTSHTRSDAILDLVITEEPDVVKDITELGPLDTGDHTALELKLQFQISGITSTRTTYDYARADFVSMKP